MTYRDDRGALHARNEALQEEIEQLREENQRAHERLVALQVERGLEVDELVPPSRKFNARAALLMLAVAAALFSSVMIFRSLHQAQAARAEREARLQAEAFLSGRPKQHTLVVRSSTLSDVPVGSACSLTYTMMPNVAFVASDPARLTCHDHAWVMPSEGTNSMPFSPDQLMFDHVQGELRFSFDEKKGEATLTEGAKSVTFDLHRDEP